MGKYITYISVHMYIYTCILTINTGIYRCRRLICGTPKKKTNTNQLQEEEDLAARARVNTTESDDESPKSPKDALIPTERPDGIEEMEWYGMVGFSDSTFLSIY